MRNVHRLLMLLAVGASAALPVAAQSDVPMRGIDHHNRVLLLRARVQGKTAGIVLILTRLGTVPQVMEQVRALGAEIQAHFDEVGYVRVRLPLAQFARLRAIPGVLEGGVLDMTHPALQTARLITGDSVPKIEAIITASSYDPDPPPGATDSVLTRDTMPNITRVRRTGPIDARDGSFSVEGRTYHAPRPGRYSFGVYTGYVKIPGGPHAVLWDSGGKVWVDTNRDRDFRDEAVLGDFNRTHTTGYLRRDSTAAKAERAAAVAGAFDSGGTALHLYQGTQGHPTRV